MKNLEKIGKTKKIKKIKIGKTKIGKTIIMTQIQELNEKIT